jgi:hypothetical protein
MLRKLEMLIVYSDYEKFNASMKQDMSKFNEQARNNRDAFNATNAAAVEAADIADKRRRNEIDTATTNAINIGRMLLIVLNYLHNLSIFKSRNERSSRL